MIYLEIQKATTTLCKDCVLRTGVGSVSKREKPEKDLQTVHPSYPVIDAQGWSPDSDPVNANWIRTIRWTQPTNATDFFESLDIRDKTPEEQQIALDEFMSLPCSIGMPDELIGEILSMGFTLPGITGAEKELPELSK